MNGKVYTLGYGIGINVDDLAAWLEEADAWLIDVRYKPSSRDSRWRGEQLTRKLGKRYVHAGGLGNVNYRGGPIQLADPEPWYENIQEAVEAGRVLVLMCGCRNPWSCHRATIANELVNRGIARPQELTKAELRRLARDQTGLFGGQQEGP